MEARFRRMNALDMVANGSMIASAVFVAWFAIVRLSDSPDTSRPAEAQSQVLLPLAGANLLGSPTSQVVLVEFGDFDCPSCRRFAVNTLPTLIAKYVRTGQLLVA